jgi:hypothetical protein
MPSITDHDDALYFAAALHVQSGVDGKRIALIVRDESVGSEGMLEDVNSLLNGGMIPGLFTTDETNTIVSAVTTRAQSEGLHTMLGRTYCDSRVYFSFTAVDYF